MPLNRGTHRGGNPGRFHAHIFPEPRDTGFSEALGRFRHGGRNQAPHDPLDLPEVSPLAGRNFRLKGGEISGSIRFCSASEAVCALMMQRYIPEFRIEDGKTTQIPVLKRPGGDVVSLDFYVNGIGVEWHPVRMWSHNRRKGDFDPLGEYDHLVERLPKKWDGRKGDFDSLGEYKKYLRTLDGLGHNERKEFEAATKVELQKRYGERRKETFQPNPRFRDTEIVVVGTPEDLFRRIIKRFGHGFTNEHEFVHEFKEALKLVVNCGGSNGQSRSKPA